MSNYWVSALYLSALYLYLNINFEERLNFALRWEEPCALDRIAMSWQNRCKLPVSKMNKLGCYLIAILSSIYGLNAADNLTCEGELIVDSHPFARPPLNREFVLEILESMANFNIKIIPPY